MHHAERPRRLRVLAGGAVATGLCAVLLVSLHALPVILSTHCCCPDRSSSTSEHWQQQAHIRVRLVCIRSAFADYLSIAYLF